MSATACILKKKACNPPALATLRIPEDILEVIASGLVDKKLAEDAGLAEYLMRCAWIDEQAQAKGMAAAEWFIENVRLIEAGEKPLPPPPGWGSYGPLKETGRDEPEE